MFGDVKSKEKCRKPVQIGKGAASQGFGKLSLRTQNATTGAEARTDFGALRGAEAPLFHVTAGGYGSEAKSKSKTKNRTKNKVKVSGRGRPLYTLQGTHV